jgi:hypothetical protein
MKLIDKDAVLAEIEKLVDKGKYCEEHDCAYRDGNNGALYALKGKLDTLEVKERDLNEEIESYFKGFGKFPSVGIDDCIDIAKHFFEFGLKSKSSYVGIPNIDNTLKEMGVDPDSKDIKIFKESFYEALENLKKRKENSNG